MLQSLNACSGEGVVVKRPYTNLMVKYCFNFFTDYISRDVPCFCGFVFFSVEKSFSERERKVFFFT